MFADNGGADRVIAANANAQNETGNNQQGEVWHQRRGQRANPQNKQFDAVDRFAPNAVCQEAKEQRADEGGDQRRTADERLIFRQAGGEDAARAHRWIVGDEQQHRPDDKQVIGIGEKAHPGNHRRFPVKARKLGPVETPQQLQAGVERI